MTCSNSLDVSGWVRRAKRAEGAAQVHCQGVDEFLWTIKKFAEVSAVYPDAWKPSKAASKCQVQWQQEISITMETRCPYLSKTTSAKRAG